MLEQVGHPNWLLITGDYFRNRPRQTQVRVSKGLARALGFSPEELMLLAVKSGVFPVQYVAANAGPTLTTRPTTTKRAGTT